MKLEAGKPEIGSREAKAGRSRAGGTLIIRSLVWVLISSAFLVWNVHRIVQMHALGLRLHWWAYVQVVLWLLALGFWLWTGWRDFRRRDSSPG